MDQEITEEELKEIARQLSCPDGEQGIEMAEVMNDTNIRMTRESIKALEIEDDNVILELGHGNCGHLSEIVAQSRNIRFYGLEVSETMLQEAKRKNKGYLAQNKIEFRLYDGKTIPFQDDRFDKIMTVNTIYFWHSPMELLNEIYRVLKDKGRFVLTFAQKQFMKQLPFVKHGFNLFDDQDITELVNKTDFQLAKILNKTEKVKSKSGELVNRDFSIIILKKDNHNS